MSGIGNDNANRRLAGADSDTSAIACVPSSYDARLRHGISFETPNTICYCHVIVDVRVRWQVGDGDDQVDLSGMTDAHPVPALVLVSVGDDWSAICGVVPSEVASNAQTSPLNWIASRIQPPAAGSRGSGASSNMQSREIENVDREAG